MRDEEYIISLGAYADVSVDFTGADIYRLFIGTENAKVRFGREKNKFVPGAFLDA